MPSLKQPLKRRSRFIYVTGTLRVSRNTCRPTGLQPSVLPPMSDNQEQPRFETVDWDELDQSRRIVSAERATLLVSLLVVAALYLYDSQVAHVYLVFDWEVERLEWLFLASLTFVLAYVVVPLFRRRTATREVLGSLRSRPLVSVALGYLGVFTVVGVVGPLLLPESLLNVGYEYNPPPGFTSEVYRECAGQTTGSGFEKACRGSIRFPLGTGALGRRVEHLVVAGARPALYVLVIGGVLVVPIATVVGVAAGLRGGLLDKLLLTYVDLQLSIPTLLVYFVAFLTVAHGASLLLFLAAFGLLSWGGLARLIRSEVIQRRERGHVTVARSLGASELYVAKRHIIPNITNTLIPAVAHVLALLLLYQAGLAFLGFYDPNIQSWGATIGQSVDGLEASQHLPRAEEPASKIWWVSTFPALALTFTMLSLKLIGDGLRDALDPRGEQQ